jgi:excisionase family DNA binding protein
MKSLANGLSGIVRDGTPNGFYTPHSVREAEKKEGARAARELLVKREEAAKSGAPGGGAFSPDERRAVEAGWLRVDQVAKRLNLDAKYVYRLIASGQLRAVNFGKRMWRVREDMLLGFIQERAQRSLPEIAERWDRELMQRGGASA